MEVYVKQVSSFHSNIAGSEEAAEHGTFFEGDDCCRAEKKLW